jgi:hypothetical protein
MTVNTPPEGAFYIKPNPCYAAKPTAAAMASPITSCTKFSYHVGSTTRGDCSKDGVANDPMGCWIAVTYDPGSGLDKLQVTWTNQRRALRSPAVKFKALPGFECN